jgi:cellulose synthase/poly-beta-1,6-N-acetylglucosamine synthase-like glycosyltransferase
LIVALACLTALILIWAGYPLVVFALAALRPRRRDATPASERPFVTLVLATREGRAHFEERLRNAFDTDYPADRLDAVVCLDAASEVAKAGPWQGDRFQVVIGDDPGGKAAGLNAGVRSTSAEILVFTDVAQVFDRTTIPVLVDALQADAGLGAVSGMLALGSKGRGGLMEAYWNAERRLREREAMLHSAVGVTGAVYAMRRSCWEDLPAGIILDDLYGPMRLTLQGWRIGFRADAQARDERVFDVQQEFRRKVRTLTGVLQLCAWLPAVLNPFRNPIWIQFVCHKLLRMFTPYLVAVAAISLGIAGTAALLNASRSAALIALTILAGTIIIVAASRKLHTALRMGTAMQLAVLRATMNGLRGNWDVWTR